MTGTVNKIIHLVRKKKIIHIYIYLLTRVNGFSTITLFSGFLTTNPTITSCKLSSFTLRMI